MSVRPVPPDLADDFEAHDAGATTAIVRRDFVDALSELGLLGSPASPRDALPTAGGRGGAWIAHPSSGPQAVVRPGRRGGWFGRLVRSRYFLGDRYGDELVLTERLRRRGAPVPEPLAAVRRDRAVGYETWLATRRIGGAQPAAIVLRGAAAAGSPGLLDAMGRGVRALHDAGGDHADLNAWNILLAEADGEIGAHVVDLDRGALRPAPLAPARAKRNLARLRRSLLKLGLEGALAEWEHFERGYASAPDA